jgi:hypothetical protein
MPRDFASQTSESRITSSSSIMCSMENPVRLQYALRVAVIEYAIFAHYGAWL